VESRRKVWLSWSSGKDSAYALHVLKRRPDLEVTGLFTSVTGEFDRVSMHAIRTSLLRRQAEAIDLHLEIVSIPDGCSDPEYRQRMVELVRKARDAGVEDMAFGDLFLEDVREYRERMLADTGIRGLFPLWGYPTRHLAQTMICSEIRAVLTCVDPKRVPKELVGREFDSALLDELPRGTDPCGEFGEFHTFVYDAPFFRAPIAVQAGDAVERGGFAFRDFHAPGESA
jgi:uncharacterized protein (TIGR00290 family)